MDVDSIKRLLALMSDNDLVELELEEEGRKVRLRKSEPAPVVAAPIMAAVGKEPSSGAGPIPVASPAAGPPRPANHVEIRSPLVGTFYVAPKPGAEPFVSVGDKVAPDKTVCIVEAMKVMNEIKAEMAGTIREVLARNGQPVEFNEPLFLVEKSE
jgi:acetyl-CoA carboxylase biotin carboxyl carrier protein